MHLPYRPKRALELECAALSLLCVKESVFHSLGGCVALVPPISWKHALKKLVVTPKMSFPSENQGRVMVMLSGCLSGHDVLVTVVGTSCSQWVSPSVFP